MKLFAFVFICTCKYLAITMCMMPFLETRDQIYKIGQMLERGGYPGIFIRGKPRKVTD